MIDCSAKLAVSEQWCCVAASMDRMAELWPGGVSMCLSRRRGCGTYGPKNLPKQEDPLFEKSGAKTFNYQSWWRWQLKAADPD
jgi:hypothetical protein